MKGAPHLANRFDVLAKCTYGVGMDMFANDLPNPPPSSNPTQEPNAPCNHSLTHTQEQSTKIAACLRSIHSRTTHSVAVLLDSGATGMFIDREFVRHNHLKTHPIPKPIPVYNIDGTPNQNGSISEEYEAILEIGSHSKRVSLAVTNLG